MTEKKYKYVRNKVGLITFGFVIRSKACEKLMTFLLKLSFCYVSAISTSSLISENGCLNYDKETKTFTFLETIKVPL